MWNYCLNAEIFFKIRVFQPHDIMTLPFPVIITISLQFKIFNFVFLMFYKKRHNKNLLFMAYI